MGGRRRRRRCRIDHTVPYACGREVAHAVGPKIGVKGNLRHFLRRYWLRLRLVTSQGSPYPSRSPRAHPSGWTRTQGLSHRDSHAPPSFGTTPVRMWNWPLAPLLRRAGNQVVREMPSHTRPSNPEAGSESSDPPRRPLTITRRNGTNGFNGCPSDSEGLRKLGRRGQGYGGWHAAAPNAF